MDAPSTASYILTSPNLDDLPQSRTLLAAGGIVLNNAGLPVGTLTVQTTGNLANLDELSSPGFMSYNSTSNTIRTTTLSTGTGISIANADGQSGSATFSVVDDSTIQKINVTNDGITPVLSTRSTLNFISDSHISVTVVDNVGEGTAEIRITASGTIPVDPDVDPAAGTLLVGNGTEFVALPRGADGSVLTSTADNIAWENINVPRIVIMPPTPLTQTLQNGVTFVTTTPFPGHISFTLPADPVPGDIYRVIGGHASVGLLAGGWVINQLAGQAIRYLGQTTVTGVLGQLSAIGSGSPPAGGTDNGWASIELVCVSNDGVSSVFTVSSSHGSIYIVHI